MTDSIDYSSYVDAAMRGVVRDVLRQVEKQGLKGQHHFFIALRTDFPGVVMSDGLRAKYPREITIVMQHQFWDLKVEQDQFRVALSFNNVPEKLTVPFAALTGFTDPSTKFGLQFHTIEMEEEELPPQKPARPAPAVLEEGDEDAPAGNAEDKIITLDAFRKK